MIVLALDPNPTMLRRALEWRLLRKIGTYAYGMYVFHYPLAYLLIPIAPRIEGVMPSQISILPAVLTFTAIGFLASLVIAAASWHVSEAPILRLKRFFVAERPLAART